MGKGLETGIVSPFGVNPTERRDDFRQSFLVAQKRACNDSGFQGISGLPRL
jgi:hypothetical protein